MTPPLRPPLTSSPAGRPPGRGGARLAVALLLAALLCLLAAAPAGAAPPQPTMGLAELRAALASGPLDGYFLTTMKGTTPERLSATVDSIVDYPWGSLILFHSDDPAVSAIGGIAAGMSGSPLYVDDGGTDKLVGAVSYGDWFTLQGLGLATPIEYMAAIEERYAPPVGLLAPPPAPKPGALRLPRPVDTGAATVREVVLAPSAAAAAGIDAAPGTTVMAPLGIIEIGGLRPQGDAFRRLAARLEQATGLVVKAGGGGGLWDGPPTPDLEPGSPGAILFSLGKVWVGAAGTVTYVNGDRAMLFGHPFDWLGPVDAALTGGNVDGVWADAMTPYKLISPRDVKGAVVQDRYWGVLAELGREPDFYPMTTTVSLVDEGREVSDLTYVSGWFSAQPMFADLPAFIAAQVIVDAADAGAFPGSAESTATVRVSDASGEYTVVRENLHDSGWDASWGPADDLAGILLTLADDPDGVLDPHIDGIDLQVALTPARRSARIAGVELPAGLYWGDNPVRITYYRYGSRDLESLDATLTIPAGTPLQGVLSVAPAAWGGGGCCSCCCEGEETGPPRTLAEVVESLNALPKNSDLLLTFSPGGAEGGGGEERSGDSCEEAEPGVTVTVPTGLVFRNAVSQATAELRLSLHPRRVPYGGLTLAEGCVAGSEDVGVTLYRQDAGSDALVQVGRAVAVADPLAGCATFSLPIAGLKRNATVVAMVDATATRLPGTATRPLTVSAWVRLAGDRRLAVRVRPGDADGTAVLLRRVGDRWQRFRTVAVTDGAGTTTLKPGTYVLRARFLGSDVCGPGTSPLYRVTVR